MPVVLTEMIEKRTYLTTLPLVPIIPKHLKRKHLVVLQEDYYYSLIIRILQKLLFTIITKCIPQNKL